jgi:hypothetical protein
MERLKSFIVSMPENIAHPSKAFASNLDALGITRLTTQIVSRLIFP